MFNGVWNITAFTSGLFTPGNQVTMCDPGVAYSETGQGPFPFSVCASRIREKLGAITNLAQLVSAGVSPSFLPHIRSSPLGESFEIIPRN